MHTHNPVILTFKLLTSGPPHPQTNIPGYVTMMVYPVCELLAAYYMMMMMMMMLV